MYRLTKYYRKARMEQTSWHTMLSTMTREQMESMLALDGWEPFTRYKVFQLKRGNLRTTGWPVELMDFPARMRKDTLPAPVDWSDIPDPKFRALFKGVYKHERNWR